MAVRPLLQVPRRIGTAETKTAREVSAMMTLENMLECDSWSGEG